MNATNEMRPELTELPERMKHLPVDKRGYVVPWFVAWPNGPQGEPEFRAMDGEKFIKAVREKRCWVCGEPLGRNMVFVIGPMCGVNRVSSEPPSHLECARWSVRNGQFMALRQIKRREDEFTESCPVAGHSIKRNPGVCALWCTREYRPFRDGKGGVLIQIGEPFSIEWFAHGRAATRAEIDESVRTGFPFLVELAELEGPKAVEELNKQRERFEKLLPPHPMKHEVVA